MNISMPYIPSDEMNKYRNVKTKHKTWRWSKKILKEKIPKWCGEGEPTKEFWLKRRNTIVRLKVKAKRLGIKLDKW